MHRAVRKRFVAILLAVSAAFFPTGVALADFCIGDNCGESRGPNWHCHFISGGQECWDAADDTCETAPPGGAGLTFQAACPFSGPQAVGSASVSSAVQVTNELFTSFVAPATPPGVTRQLEGGSRSKGVTVETSAGGEEARQDNMHVLASEVSGVLQYESYEYAKRDTSLYGVKLGYEFDSDSVGLGIRVPFQYMSFKGGVNGYRFAGEFDLKGHLVNRRAVAWNLGLAGLINGLKIDDVDLTYFYGGGPFTSLDLLLGPVGASIGGGGTYTRPKDGDGMITFMAGGSLGLPLFDLLSASVHGYYTMLYDEKFNEINLNLSSISDTSNSFANFGLELGFMLTRSWALKGGYNYRWGFGDYSSNEIYIGTAARF